jgi:hypothetical protein
MQACWNGPRRLVPVLTLAFLLVAVRHLHAHDDLAWRMLADGDVSRAEWFETLKTPSGESCCSVSDCRKIRAVWRGDTEGWWANVNGTWRPIPAEKVLTSPRSIDGAAYICMGNDSPGSSPDRRDPLRGNVPSLLGAIYCFVPPEPGT